MKCKLLDEIYDEVVIKYFEEALPKGTKNLWAINRCLNTHHFDTCCKLCKNILHELLKVINNHLDNKGYIEVLKIEEGKIIESGIMLDDEKIIEGYVLRILCYKHLSQLFVRLYIKSIRNKLILTLYGDLEEDTPWLINKVNPNKLKLHRS